MLHVSPSSSPLRRRRRRPAPPPTARQAYYHFSLAQQSRLAGEVEEALDEYRKALRVDPASGALHTELARMLRESGRGAEALVEAEAAVRIDPTDAEASWCSRRCCSPRPKATAARRP